MIGGIMIMTIMMAMTIKVSRVMPMMNMPGMVQAHVTVQVPDLSARAVIENIRRHEAGAPLRNVADLGRGY